MGYHRPICVYFWLIALVSSCIAQSAAGRIEGQLSPLQGILPDRLSIEAVSDGRVVDRTDSSRDGSFALRHLPAGRYEIRVVDLRGDVLRSDLVDVGIHTSHLEMRVPGIKTDRPASGSISVRALAKPTPKNARKEMERSEKAFASGDSRKSLAHLSKAIEICPDCPEIHNSLGVRQMKLSSFDQAVVAFTKAVELDPHSATANANLALALVTLRDYPRAEPAAQKALDLDHGSVPARYALGLIALFKRDCSTEAVRHLKVAAEHYPRAHLSAATMLQCAGEMNGAIEELNAYLGTPNAEHRERVQSWITKLKSTAQ